MAEQKQGIAGSKVPAIFDSNMLFPISAAIQNPAYFHDVSDHHIENSEVSYMDAVIRVLALPYRVDRLKGFRARLKTSSAE